MMEREEFQLRSKCVRKVGRKWQNIADPGTSKLAQLTKC